jgi:hypothetical protein
VRGWLREAWWVALAIVVAAAVVAWPRIWPPIREIVRPSPPKLTVTMTAEMGEACGPSFARDGILAEQRVLEVGVTNHSDRDVAVKRVRVVPGWLTGGFYAGENVAAKPADVLVDDWMGMLVIAKGASPQREAGQAALVAKGSAKKQEAPGQPIWWVRPEPIEVRTQALANGTIKRRSEERFRLRLGLKGSIEAVEGPVHVEIEPDAGPPVASPWLSVAVCTPAPPKPPAAPSKGK